MSRTDTLHNIFISISGNTWQKKLDTLVLCKCCERHNINKPTTMIPWIELDFNITQDKPCNCSCRHVARFICRQFEDNGLPLTCPTCEDDSLSDASTYIDE